MKPKRLKVYARVGLISTKLPIVKNSIEIITHIQMYQNNMKMVLDATMQSHQRVRGETQRQRVVSGR